MADIEWNNHQYAFMSIDFCLSPSLSLCLVRSLARSMPELDNLCRCATTNNKQWIWCVCVRTVCSRCTISISKPNKMRLMQSAAIGCDFRFNLNKTEIIAIQSVRTNTQYSSRFLSAHIIQHIYVRSHTHTLYSDPIVIYAIIFSKMLFQSCHYTVY